ncbi:MAG: hypothetical protein JWL59_3413 [Chthoniobacteraceae bacterium]|nr:hypothetical protein [Chthoniobacteraceae bacterium]
MASKIYPVIEPLEGRIAPAFAAVIDLSGLNGNDGFKINPEGPRDPGLNLSDVGDLNGDGYDDIVLGDPGVASGKAYVVFGKAGGFPASLDRSALNGLNGFTINAEKGVNGVGFAAHSPGDLNGDGVDDLLLTALGDTAGHEPYFGISYVLFGKTGGFSPNVELTALKASEGFQIRGLTDGAVTGIGVTGAADVNGDHFQDLLIGGSELVNGKSLGTSYVVFGSANGFSPQINLSALNGANGFKISGSNTGESLSSPVAGGDINGDGFEDLLISSTSADYMGSVYVVFGKPTGFAAQLDASSLNGGAGFKIRGETRSGSFGVGAPRVVSSARDMNGDGFDDIVIGAPSSQFNGNFSGAAYVVFGKAGPFPASFNVEGLNGSNGFKMYGAKQGDFFGLQVSNADDVNGDGFDDVLIGGRSLNAAGKLSGTGYVIFGKKTPFPALFDISALNGNNGFRLNGVLVSDFTGVTFSGAGDMNGDGLGDLVLSENGSFFKGDIGAAYVVFGKAAPTLTISDAVVLEGDIRSVGLTFTATLSEALTVPLTVGYGTLDGTAQVGSDFFGVAGHSFTFAPGQVSKAVVIDVTGDLKHEAEETFRLVLSNPSYVIVADGVGVGTIQDNDAAPLLSISNPSQFEGRDGKQNVDFTLTLSSIAGVPVEVHYTTANGTATAGSDYIPLASSTVIFAPGETSKTISVEILGDTVSEDFETFSLVLSDPLHAALVSATGTATILNDDTVVHIGDTGNHLEGNSGVTQFVIPLTLDKPSALPVELAYFAASGTAQILSDYNRANERVTFQPGETTKPIIVEVLGDTVVEESETFVLQIFNLFNATTDAENREITILNDDALIHVSDAAQSEGHSNTNTLNFTVSLATASALPVTVTYDTLDGTAKAGRDYSGIGSGTLTFAPGETSKTVMVGLLGDKRFEANETMSLVLSGPINATLGDDLAVGTINNDDVKLLGRHHAVFVDADGEIVNISVNKGRLTVEDFTLIGAGSGSQLASVDFGGKEKFANANLRIAADYRLGGDGIVNVGYIDAAGIDFGRVRIDGDLGRIDAGDSATPHRGLGSLKAGSMGQSGVTTQGPEGSLQSNIEGRLGKLKIADGMMNADLFVSGDIGSVSIKAYMSGGSIQSHGKIGSLRIAHELTSSDSSSPVTISALGGSGRGKTIGSIHIGGTVDHAEILAGYNRMHTPINADASIGRLFVGGSWFASNLVAGVTAGADGVFGTGDDASISKDTPIVSKIASVVIKGDARGTDGGSDHFGFVSEQIRAFRLSGRREALHAGPGNDLAGLRLGLTNDLTAREVV